VLIVPGDQTAYVVCEGDHVTRPGSLVEIDITAHTVTGYVNVGMFPDGIVRLPPAQ
jgi:hypothetical protein